VEIFERQRFAADVLRVAAPLEPRLVVRNMTSRVTPFANIARATQYVVPDWVAVALQPQIEVEAAAFIAEQLIAMLATVAVRVVDRQFLCCTTADTPPAVVIYHFFGDAVSQFTVILGTLTHVGLQPGSLRRVRPIGPGALIPGV
jgi:hypothetical protein